MGDLDSQAAVDQATNGCLVAVGLLGLATIGSIALALPPSIVIITLAVLLILSGLVLGVMEWAGRG